MITTTRSSSLTGADLATRVRALDFNALGLVLPNPDPLLKELGQDIAVYRNLARDPHVGACIRRRRAAVKSLDYGLDRGKSRSRVSKAVESVLARLDMDRLIGQTLDAVLYGYAPLEVSWSAAAGGLVLPHAVEGKPPEWFCFDPENQLRLKTWSAPVEGEELPDRKFLLPRQDDTYQNPYGFSDLSLCYWPVVFKKGGMRFWLQFAEKFGGAFAVGKLPRTASAEERNALLAGLEDLIGNGVATIPDDGSVELVEMAGKSASADLYESLVKNCRAEISIVLTGTNQTIEATANKASAHAGADVADDLRDADAEIVAGAVNQLIRWVVEVNWPGSEAPVWSMWDQEAQDRLQAQRDGENTTSGARLTNAYWMRAYGYQEGDLKPEAAALPPPASSPVAGTSFAEAGDAADPLAAEVDQLDTAAAPAWSAMLETITALVNRAESLPALQRALTNAYGGLDSAELVRVMAAALALAELKGMAEVADEVRSEAGG